MYKWLAVFVLGLGVTAHAGIRDVSPPQWPDVTTKYIGRDFAPLLTPKWEFIGFIGTDFQRLKIHFASVSKDATDPQVYHITGTSEVKANRCTLDGTITVTKLSGAKSGILRDEDGNDLGIRYRGSLYGRYEI